MTDTIVFGLDGATWEVLDPLIAQGRLPNIEAVMGDGHSGVLESTFPPITAPAWLSMATGRNPGKTGVFYFLNRNDPDSFEFETLGSDKFQGQSFWDFLSVAGDSVGIFNYPMLYPPYDLKDGFIVSGLGSGETNTITYPRSLQSELDDVTGGYQVKVPYADPKFQNKPGELESALLEIIEKRETAIEYLLTSKDIDHFFGIISATDWAQHYFWNHYDSTHPLHDPETDHADALGRIWERVDDTVGMVADIARTEDAQLFIVSDHGFGPVRKTFHSNEWLKREGFTKSTEQSSISKLRTRYFPYLRQIGEAIVRAVPQLNSIVKSVGKSIQQPPGAEIDFERSIAFAPRQNLTCGMIYMLSDDPDDRQTVIDALYDLADDRDDLNSTEVYEPSDLYHGSKTPLAPDILFELDGFECAVDPRPSTGNDIVSTGSPSLSRSGGHNRDGIFITNGPGIERGSNLRMSIYDIAPTILYLHNIAIPEAIDGTVLTDIFDTDLTENRSVERTTESALGAKQGDHRDDDQAVQDRLEDLGYI